MALGSDIAEELLRCGQILRRWGDELPGLLDDPQLTLADLERLAQAIWDQAAQVRQLKEQILSATSAVVLWNAAEALEERVSDLEAAIQDRIAHLNEPIARRG